MRSNVAPSLSVLCLSLLFALLLSACDTVDSVVVEDPDPQPVASAKKSTSDDCVDLTDSLYRVCYEGATYDGTTTTFEYTAYATGTGISSSDNFFLEIPQGRDTPVSTTPKNPFQFTDKQVEGRTVSGIEWGKSVSRNGRSYSYTFTGNVGEGVITTVIEGSEYFTYSDELTGPAAAVFKIDGTVFNDTDGLDTPESGTYESDLETALGGVTLALSDDDGTLIATTTTNADGVYVFDELRAGSYTVAVPLTNALYASYEGSPIYVFTSGSTDSDGAAARSTTVGPDTTLDFGFWVDGSLFAQALQDPTSIYGVQLTGDNRYWAPILNGLFDGPAGGSSAHPYTVNLNGYDVSYRGRFVDLEQGETTYYYRARDVRDQQQKEASNLVLEYDAPDDERQCDVPIRTSPAAEIGQDPNSGIEYAVKWNVNIAEGETADFSMTFAGTDLRPGAIKAALKAGTTIENDFLPGPCARSVDTRAAVLNAVTQVVAPSTVPVSSSFRFLTTFDELFQLENGETVQKAVHRLVTPLPHPLDSPFSEETFLSLTVSKEVKLLLGLSTRQESLADRSFLDIEGFLANRFGTSKLVTSKLSSPGPTPRPKGGDGGTTDRESTLRAF